MWPDELVVRMPGLALPAPAQATFMLTLDERGRAIDLTALDAGVPTAAEAAVRAMLDETRFAQYAPAIAQALAKLKVRVRFVADGSGTY